MKTKLLIITANNEFELVKKFNEDKREFFATQPVQKLDKTWVMFCYYNSSQENRGDTPIRQRSSKLTGEEGKVSNQPNRNTADTSSKATKSQLDYIYGNSLDVNTENLTKKEAWRIIKEHKEKKNEQ